LNDLTYEFQRMFSRKAEIEAATKASGAQAAWEQYSRAHGLDQRRFKGELATLRSRFDTVGAGREPKN
jgi:hypothetical protein